MFWQRKRKEPIPPRHCSRRLQIEALEDRWVLASIPLSVQPATAEVTLLAPGRTDLSILTGQLGSNNEKLFAFATDGIKAHDHLEVLVSPEFAGHDICVGLYDINGNRITHETAASADGVVTINALIQSDSVYILGIFLSAPGPIVDVSVGVTVGEQVINDAITIDRTTSVTQFTATAPQNAHDASWDVDYYPLEFSNHTDQFSIAASPYLSGGLVQTIFYRPDSISAWQPIASDNSITGTVDVTASADTASSLNDGEYMLAIAPAGFAGPAGPYDLTITAVPAGPAAMNPLPVVTNLAALTPASLGHASQSVTDDLTGVEQLYSFRPSGDGDVHVSLTAAFEPVVSVYSADGLHLLANDSAGFGNVAEVKFAALQSEAYVVRIADRGNNQNGGFTLTIDNPFFAPVVSFNDAPNTHAYVADLGLQNIGGSSWIGRVIPAGSSDALVIDIDPGNGAGAVATDVLVMSANDVPHVLSAPAGQRLQATLPMSSTDIYEVYVRGTGGTDPAHVRLGQIEVLDRYDVTDLGLADLPFQPIDILTGAIQAATFLCSAMGHGVA